MSNFYDKRSDLMDVDDRNERHVSKSFPPNFSYGSLPSIPAGSEAGTSLDEHISHDNSDADSRMLAATPYEQLYPFPSPSSPVLPNRHLFHPSFMRASFSETQFPQSNIFSALEGHLSPSAMAAHDNMHTANATDSIPRISPHRNSGTDPSFASTPLSDTQGPWHEDSNSCFSTNLDTPGAGRRTHEYAEDFTNQMESWSPVSSSSNRANNLDSMTESAMFTGPFGPMSRSSNREEAIPISSIETPRCQGCSSLDIFESYNHYLLHYWHEHAPHASSPHAWKSQRCIWNSCELEKEFRTPKSWVDHAFNVHYPRFYCPREGCTWLKPFGTQNLVRRHIGTIHEPPKNCQIPGCQGRRNKIDRKDKKDEHNDNYHGPLVCDVVGCPRGCIGGQNHGFTKPADLEKHFKNKHKYLRSRRVTTRA